MSLVAAIVVPFALIAPSAPATDSARITLAWTATGDDDSIGTASSYALTVNDTVYVLDQVPLPAGSRESIEWTIHGPTVFGLRAFDERGNASAPSNAASALPTAGAESYLCTWQDAHTGAIVLKTGWAGPSGAETGRRTPRPPGQPDTVWIVFSEAVGQEGFLEVARVAGDQWTAPVYAGHMATMVRADTTLFWGVASGGDSSGHDIHFRLAPSTPYQGRAWHWIPPTLLPYELRAARLVTASQIQWETRARLCVLFGHYGMAGERRACE